MTSRDVIRALTEDGWKLARVKGDHHQFTHPTKPGTVTVQHPVKDLKPAVLSSIRRQSGLKLR